MTSATAELRRLLDERGVEWWAEDDPEDPPYYLVTKWFSNANEQTFEEIPAIRSRSLKAFCITPEQAVAATLGETPTPPQPTPPKQPPYDELIESPRRELGYEPVEGVE